MSTYVSGSAAFTVVPQIAGLALAGVTAAGVAAAQCIRSAALAMFAVPAPLPVTASPLDRLASTERRLREVQAAPGADALLRTLAGARYTDALAGHAAAAEALQAGDLPAALELRQRADGDLRAAIAQAESGLAREERVVGTHAAARALGRLGYAVDAASGARSTGLWAVRGDTVLAMLIQDGGAIEMDWAGCAGDVRRPVMAELVAALAEEGMRVEFAHVASHGDAQGGQLVRRSARTAQRGAAGLVAQHEIGLAVPAAVDARTVAQRQAIR